MSTDTHIFLAVGIIGIPFVMFHWRRSLLLLAFVFLASGCSENEAPHSRSDTVAHTTPPSPGVPPSGVDSSEDSMPASIPKETVPPTDSTIRKKESSRKIDSVPNTGTSTTGKNETQTRNEGNAKAGEGGENEKSGKSNGCAEITPDLIKQGRMVFIGQGNCRNCHGAEGQGNPLGPDLTDGKWLHISNDYSSIAKVVRTGVNLVVEHSTPMPPMGGARLSDEEICAVAAYVWSLTH